MNKKEIYHLLKRYHYIIEVIQHGEPKLDTDFRRKYKNVVVVDENDPRPIQEQIKEIFGDGPEPKFRNPEFDKK